MMNGMRNLSTAILLVLGLAATASAGGVKITSSWISPDAAQMRLAGQKVAALVVSDDMSLRMSAEEALARDLTARGLQGVAAYRLIPKEELKDTEKVKGWFERAGIKGVVVMRLVSAETRSTYTPGYWATPNYGTFWGYYGYAWNAVYIPPSGGDDQVFTIETMIYNIPKNALGWAGVSETKNPKGLQPAMTDLAAAIAKEMKKQGLTKK
jgi:hypothetical protein